MTKSAKQDTKKAPAEPAVTESAATRTETPVPTAPETAEGATDQDAGDQDEGTAKPDLDDTKRKFRAALERKNQTHGEGQEKGGRDGGKINGAHGPAASRRSFRRKSG